MRRTTTSLYLALVLGGMVASAPPGRGQESEEPTVDLADDLIIETETGALRDAGSRPRALILLDTVMPLGMTPIGVRLQGFSVQDVREVVVEVDGEVVARLEAPPFEVEFDFGRRPRRHEIIATVYRTEGPPVTGSRVTQAPASVVFETAVDVVDVKIIVKDADGNRVRDLQRGEFTVLENGVVQSIRDFVRERAPLSLVLVLDSSGSMEGRMWSLKKSAIDFVRKVDADVPIQVVDFDHDVRLEQEFTLDRDRVVAAINRLEEGGGTHLWEAAYSGAFGLSGRTGRRAVVLFTDGKDQTHAESEERIVEGLPDVVDLARQEDVQFYCIGFGRKIDEPTLIELSAETGGVFYRAASTKEFRVVYDAILADVAAQYVLTYASTNPERDGTYRAIEVRLSRPDLTAIYRKGYRASPRDEAE